MLPSTWPDLPDEQLLDARMADLPLAIEGHLAARIDQLRSELSAAGLRFDIHFYLSDEWFTPDGSTAIAVPFYLAHPRLEKLEETQMLEVEGGEEEWCMRILRHEAGHAIDNAFRLRLRRQRREVFGSPTIPYPEFYTPKPYSKSFVLHLDAWYAQSHPDEDFAETFAVWLTPSSEWRQRYLGWPAMKKIEYMDVLMHSLRARPCASTTARSGATTAWTIRASTTATSDAFSRTHRSVPRTSPPRSSSRESVAPFAAWSRAGRASTSTQSTA
jgi:hypothetical protein